jgi:hypothetical protein
MFEGLDERDSDMKRLILTISPVLLIASTAFAAERYVPSDYATIQSAINASSAGDEVIVSPGTYHEAINLLGRAITVRSSGGADLTVIDASGLNTSAVKFQSGELPSTVLEGFTITGGSGTVRGVDLVGGGIYCFGANPVIRDCVVSGNVADSGAGMFSLASSVTVEGCNFDLNEAQGGDGGGGLFCSLGSPTITNTRFYANASATLGGAISLAQCSPEITNCVFELNAAVFGGAVRNFSASPTFVNCTFSHNYANMSLSDSGGALSNVYNSDVTVINSIMWDNYPTCIAQTSDASTTVNYTNIQGGWSGPGTAVMNSHPMWDDELRLLEDSPCVDQGDNDAAAAAELETDMDGNDRIVNDHVDLGAFESQANGTPDCNGDLNGDLIIDALDILALFAAWGDGDSAADVNGDGRVDALDLIQLLAMWGACP